MRFLTLITLLTLLVSCGDNNSSSGGSKFRNTTTLSNMRTNSGIYFERVYHRDWRDISWIEIRCIEKSGITNDSRARTLMQVFEKTDRIVVKGKVLRPRTAERMVNEALRLLDWRPYSTRCPDRVLAQESHWY